MKVDGKRRGGFLPSLICAADKTARWPGKETRHEAYKDFDDVFEMRWIEGLMLRGGGV